jgi:hypothetical protein
LSYQFSFKDKGPADEFEQMPCAELSETILYTWMKEYFLEG